MPKRNTNKKGPIRRTAETVRTTAKKGSKKVAQTIKSNNWKTVGFGMLGGGLVLFASLFGKGK